MKKYLGSTALIFMTVISYGQRGFGFDLGFSSTKAPMLDVKYFIDKNAASIGVTYQFYNNALGSKEDAIAPGTYAIGDGDYFYSIDIGYTRILSEHFSGSAEVSFATRRYYQNLSDNSFSEGGYHIIYKTKSEVGIGGIVTYNFNDMVGIFGGYNTVRHAFFGVQLKFVKYKKYATGEH